MKKFSLILEISPFSDYDEKAEDAVDYEDIDEQYEGPEVQVATEEDHLLSKENYNDASFALSNNKTFVFDEENYDEDEDAQKGTEVETINSEIQSVIPTGRLMCSNLIYFCYFDP